MWAVNMFLISVKQTSRYLRLPIRRQLKMPNAHAPHAPKNASNRVRPTYRQTEFISNGTLTVGEENLNFG